MSGGKCQDKNVWGATCPRECTGDCPDDVRGEGLDPHVRSQVSMCSGDDL